jgi:hypothetical protein
MPAIATENSYYFILVFHNMFRPLRAIFILILLLNPSTGKFLVPSETKADELEIIFELCARSHIRPLTFVHVTINLFLLFTEICHGHSA